MGTDRLIVAVISALAVGAAVAPAAAHGSNTAHGSSLVPPTAVCGSQVRLDAPVRIQERVMRCMADHARRAAGMPGLSTAPALRHSARRKSGDILRCDEFSHYACGRDFKHWIERTGYISTPCWRIGENLAWGRGGEGTVRSIFRAWMRSATHRENILSPQFSEIGISLRIGALAGQPSTRIWTQHFGSHCAESAA